MQETLYSIQDSEIYKKQITTLEMQPRANSNLLLSALLVPPITTSLSLTIEPI